MIFWYILVITLFCVCLVLRSKNFKDSKLSIYIYILIVVALCIIAGIRTHIGDTDTYIRYIQETPNSFVTLIKNINFSGDWGFYVVLFVLKKILCGNAQLVLAFFSTITISAFLIKMKKLTNLYDLALYVFVCSATYIMIMNGVRQYFVSAIFFCCIDLFKEKKVFKLLLIIVLLSFIHKSALIFIPVLFFIDKPSWSKTTYIVLCIGILTYLLFPLYNSWLSSYLIKGEKYAGYAYEILNQVHGGNFIRVIVAIIPVILAKFQDKRIAKEEKYYNLIFNFSVLNIVAYLLAVRHYIFARFSFYFSPFSIILLCWDIQYIKKRSTKTAIYICCVIMYFLYYYYQVSVVWNTPYTTIFDY